MILGNDVKLSQIFNHNFDKKTDRLYQPLRKAVKNISNFNTADSLKSSNQSNGTYYP